MNRDQLYKKIDSFNDELINLRRHIHAHPELSGLENQTAILISGYLKKIGWNVRESIGTVSYTHLTLPTRLPV